MSNEAKMFAIRDRHSGDFYQSAAGKTGWYGELGTARLFKTEDGAASTIAKGGHHVSYPGNRLLHVVEVKLEVRYG